MVTQATKQNALIFVFAIILTTISVGLWMLTSLHPFSLSFDINDYSYPVMIVCIYTAFLLLLIGIFCFAIGVKRNGLIILKILLNSLTTIFFTILIIGVGLLGARLGQDGPYYMPYILLAYIAVSLMMIWYRCVSRIIRPRKPGALTLVGTGAVLLMGGFAVILIVELYYFFVS